MKKGSVLIAIFIFLTSAAVAVPERAGKSDFGINVSAFLPGDGDIDNAAAVGGNISYSFNNHLAWGISSSWAQADFDAHTAAGAKVSGSKVKPIPIFFDLILRPWTGDQPVAPYATMGLGAVIANVEGTGVLNDNNLQAQSNSDFAFRMGGGLEWFVTENWSYYLEGTYVFTGAGVDIVSSATNQKIETQGLDGWYLGGGVKYLFD